MARKGKIENNYKIFVRKRAGMRPLWRPASRCEDNWSLKIGMEDVHWTYLAVVRDTWRDFVCMVMKLGHLSNFHLQKRKSAPWSYMTRPCENRCRTWRHTQHIPEHVEVLQGRTEGLQQCLLVSKQDFFQIIL